jgi:stress responsive alpha/beta barrel protein
MTAGLLAARPVEKVTAMVWHLVLMKPRADLSVADRRAFADAFERASRAIPTIREVRVGRRVRHGAGYEQGLPDAADFLALLAFDDLEGLQAYLRHPAHEELGARFGQSLSAALVYDFEVGGIEELSRLK